MQAANNHQASRGNHVAHHFGRHTAAVSRHCSCYALPDADGATSHRRHPMRRHGPHRHPTSRRLDSIGEPREALAARMRATTTIRTVRAGIAAGGRPARKQARGRRRLRDVVRPAAPSRATHPPSAAPDRPAHTDTKEAPTQQTTRFRHTIRKPIAPPDDRDPVLNDLSSHRPHFQAFRSAISGHRQQMRSACYFLPAIVYLNLRG